MQVSIYRLMTEAAVACGRLQVIREVGPTRCQSLAQHSVRLLHLVCPASALCMCSDYASQAQGNTKLLHVQRTPCTYNLPWLPCSGVSPSSASDCGQSHQEWKALRLQPLPADLSCLAKISASVSVSGHRLQAPALEAKSSIQAACQPRHCVVIRSPAGAQHPGRSSAAGGRASRGAWHSPRLCLSGVPESLFLCLVPLFACDLCLL